MAIHWAVPWQRALPCIGRPSNWLPGCTTTIVWARKGGLKGSKAAFPLLAVFPYFHSLSVPLNIPLCLFALPLCHYLYISVSVSLSLPLCLAVSSLFLILAPHPQPPVIRSRLPDPVHINQSFFPAAPETEKNALCALEHPL